MKWQVICMMKCDMRIYFWTTLGQLKLEKDTKVIQRDQKTYKVLLLKSGEKWELSNTTKDMKRQTKFIL